MLTHTFTCEVEFLGGPLDGHVEEMGLPLQAFVGVRIVAQESASSFLRSLWSFWRRSPQPSVQISIYELGQRGPRLCYRFLRSQAVSQDSLGSSRGIDTLVKPMRGSP
ncbi:MAG: hypothetical protein AB7F89_04905 [Pirellulaceae bacterium]